MITISTIGQDSHRFEDENSSKPLVLGGVTIPGYPGLSGNSDADVILHAITNAISGATGINILGKIADELCKAGITDSKVYLDKALESLGTKSIVHVSITLEGKRPLLAPHIDTIRCALSRILAISQDSIGLTATSGEGLTAFGRGEGIAVFALVTCASPFFSAKAL